MLGDGIVAIKDLLNRLPTPIVFDHLGRIPEPAGAQHPAFAVIRGLLDKGRTWVKLSGAYIDTKVGPPGYRDTSALARAFAAANPEPWSGAVIGRIRRNKGQSQTTQFCSIS